MPAQCCQVGGCSGGHVCETLRHSFHGAATTVAMSQSCRASAAGLDGAIQGSPLHNGRVKGAAVLAARPSQ